jgi:type III restriction enzyme
VKLVSINSKKNVISGTVLVDIADKKGNVNRSDYRI